jgi:hypothetical protein
MSDGEDIPIDLAEYYAFLHGNTRTQSFNIVVYDFGTTNHLIFNTKIYVRNPSKSYRIGEAQRNNWLDEWKYAQDPKIWPNSPPVDIGHTLVLQQNDAQSPYEITLNEDYGYYIVVWRDGYLEDKRRFYIADSLFYDEFGNLVGDFPNDLYFEIRQISNNAKAFV